MNKRHITHLSGVLLAGILIRALLLKYIGVWGDWGFYVYNAGLLNNGQMPFVDIIARSPLFMQLYALVAPLGNQAYLFRAFVMFWWLLAALPVYGIAREIRGHRAGLASAAVYLLTPFGIVYSAWGNTQSLAAFLAITGLYVVIRKQSIPRYGVFGALIGMAFVSRRSVVVIMPAIGLYHAYRCWQGDTPLRRAYWSTSTASVAFLGTLFVGYLWLAQWNIARATAFFDIHAVNLFISSGRGGFPLLDTPPNPAINDVQNSGIPIIHDLCQRCGTWTARTFAKTIMLITPVVGILFYYCQDWASGLLSKRDTQYVLGILGALGLYAVAVAIMHGYLIRSLGVISLALFAVVVHQTDTPPRSLLYDNRVMLLIVVLCALTAGYLYRARIIHTYYFMDFWPAISVVAGLLYAYTLEHARRIVKIVLAVAVVLAIINTSGAAYPLTNIVVDDNSGNWFTVNSVQEYGDDMDARTSPGEEVLAANPSYVALSHATMVRDNARLYYTLLSYRNTGPGRDIYEHMVPRLQNGTIRYVVHTSLVEEMLTWNQSAGDAFDANYCKVKTGDLYEKTNATLYEYTNASC
jgi:4-amino-4-deoxy-L-arabinose transferase-like glycosyltransferase